jgi:murein DD-endopeptidase MepM/ murein hydrolase activator NlpD
VGHTAPRAVVSLDGAAVTAASADGYFVVGFDRDAPAAAVLTVETPEGVITRTLSVMAGDFDVQRIDGLPQQTVTPTDPQVLARIKEEAARKAVGFASQIDADSFRGGFIMPLAATRVSARWGGQRILNGEAKPPHMGVDLAAPTGTPVHAPAAGVVSFADPDMHFEGGLVMIDHGQGLISLYLHLSRLDVRAGQAVVQGQPIGAVGMTGRATGPHLCWRMKWRGRNLDPMLMVGTKAPA